MAGWCGGEVGEVAGRGWGEVKSGGEGRRGEGAEATTIDANKSPHVRGRAWSSFALRCATCTWMSLQPSGGDSSRLRSSRTRRRIVCGPGLGGEGSGEGCKAVSNGVVLWSPFGRPGTVEGSRRPAGSFGGIGNLRRGRGFEPSRSLRRSEVGGGRGGGDAVRTRGGERRGRRATVEAATCGSPPARVAFVSGGGARVQSVGCRRPERRPSRGERWEAPGKRQAPALGDQRGRRSGPRCAPPGRSRPRELSSM